MNSCVALMSLQACDTSLDPTARLQRYVEHARRVAQWIIDCRTAFTALRPLLVDRNSCPHKYASIRLQVSNSRVIAFDRGWIRRLNRWHAPAGSLQLIVSAIETPTLRAIG